MQDGMLHRLKIIIIKAKQGKLEREEEKCFIYEAPAIEHRQRIMQWRRTIAQQKGSILMCEFKLHNAMWFFILSFCCC
jgi:hypothetical protein